MMRYHLKRSSDTVYFISLGKHRIGQVTRKHDGSGWYAWLKSGANRVEATKSTASEAFRECVQKANRIAFCGSSDEAKALAELDRHNSEVEREARERGLRVVSRRINI
jgi:hypothetical protein